MDRQERNWNILCRNLRNWHGIWTRYNPQGEVEESFQSLRSFQINREQTEITQTNRYTYADGRTEEKSWYFNKQSSNLPDGLFHPFSRSMRAVLFEDGASAWVTKQLEPGKNWGVELFFRGEELRHSVAAIYDDRGSLKRTASIREDAVNFPSKYWSAEIKQLAERNLSNNWVGTSVTMTPDLEILPPVPTQLHWNIEGNASFFYPDGISLSCPRQLSIGSKLAIAANWLVTSSELQQLTVKYDESGAFSKVTFERFHKAPAGSDRI